MKFWCASSQRKSLPKDNTSFSSSASYASISSLPGQKSDSGFSETSSIIQPCSHFERILFVERTYCEHLKEYITKYSRPLRRYLNPTEIVDLFQNIEKIFNVSKSIVRQCEKLLNEQEISHTSTGKIYQSSFGVMIDSYNVYISRSMKAIRILKQCCEKIAYFLQISTDVVIRELTGFIQLPLRHICVLNDLLQKANAGVILEAITFLSNQARCVLQHPFKEENSMLDSSSQSEMSPVMVFQRTDTELWESKQLELSQWKLSFTQIDQSVPISTSISLSNVIHIEQDASNEELCLLVASNLKTPTRYSSLRIKRIYIRFDNGNDYYIWLDYLRNAVQDAKDQSWSKTNELII